MVWAAKLLLPWIRRVFKIQSHWTDPESRYRYPLIYNPPAGNDRYWASETVGGFSAFGIQLFRRGSCPTSLDDKNKRDWTEVYKHEKRHEPERFMPLAESRKWTALWTAEIWRVLPETKGKENLLPLRSSPPDIQNNHSNAYKSEMRLTGARFPARRKKRSEERRVGKECRSRWSPYH